MLNYFKIIIVNSFPIFHFKITLNHGHMNVILISDSDMDKNWKESCFFR